MKTILVLMISAFSSVSAVHADVISEEWIQAWRADLEFVKQTLPETHAQLFHTLSQTDFNSAVEVLSTRIPGLSHHEIIVELAAIVAAVNDGHTRLTLPMVEGSNFFAGHSSTPPPNDLSMMFNHFPIRLYVYSDGLYVRSIGAEKSAYAGAKVLKIGKMSAQDAMDAVSRVVHRDNDLQLRHYAKELSAVM